MDKLIKCVFSPENAKRWDKNLKESEKISINGSKTYGFIYMSNKKQYTLHSRDFYEKTFSFYHNEKFYRYTSSVVNCSDHKPIPKETVRGTTIYNCGLIRRNDENKLVYTNIT